MPNLTIYVPDDVAAGLRRHDVAVSKTCQAALRRKIRMADRGDTVAGRTTRVTAPPRLDAGNGGRSA